MIGLSSDRLKRGNRMFERFDGTGRQPRPAQIEALKWIEANWSSKVLALNLPTGVGKSAILRAIQLQFPGTVGIVPTNILLDQYTETYKDLNYVKGIEHYTCSSTAGFSCHDNKLLGYSPCSGCPYVVNRSRAIEGEPTVFNPISYHYFSKMKAYTPPEVLVIDEAHKLVELLMLLVGASFRKSQYNYPNITSELQLVEWLQGVVDRLEAQPDKDVQIARQISKLQGVLKSLRHAPQDFIFYMDKQKHRGRLEEYLNIKPIEPPKWLLQSILECRHLILMSATLLETDLWDLGLKGYKYLDIDSPIPVAQRQVLYRPNDTPMNYETEPIEVANWLKNAMKAYPGRNTLIHVSYGWSDKLKEYFPEALTNTSETKTKVLAKFKKEGGVWLASGCAEGIDLPGDECRLNLIPIITQANPNDPTVKKKLALHQGRLKYDLEAIKLVIQQAGRSVRGIEDSSVILVGDARFPRLINRVTKYIPKSFLKAILWRVP
jgi:Rad3-related DNA helicase